MRITIDDRRGRRRLARMESGARDLTPLMADLAELMLHQTQDRFEAQADPDGLPWAPLSPRYAAGKARRGERPEILQQFGFMLDTLASDFGPTFAEVGSNAVQAATHQFGDPSRNIPARPFLGIGDDDEREIVGSAEAYLAQISGPLP